MSLKKSVQVGPAARRKCPCVSVLCVLCALFASLFGAKSASADAPVAAIQVGPLAAPAAVLGMTNPYVVAAVGKVPAPAVDTFTFSHDLRVFALRVEKLARYGLDLNQRKSPQPEKLNLRVEPRFGGGVLQLSYRR